MAARIEQMVLPNSEGDASTFPSNEGEGHRRGVSRFVRSWRGLLVGLLGLSAGWIAGILGTFVPDETMVDAPAFALLMIATLVLARVHRRSGSSGSFFAETAWAWGGWGVGWSIVDLGLTELVLGLGAFGLPTALLGWLVYRYKSI